MPFSSDEFRSYVSRLHLQKAAIDYISTTRDNLPARAVGSFGRHNTVWRYPSRKMQFALALESTEEHTYAAQLEYDASVVEYWEQPARISLSFADVRGRMRRTSYVPDFLVLGQEGVWVTQVKTAKDCAQLAAGNPNRWTWDGAVAADLAAEAYFSDIGLEHRVVADGSQRKIFAENCLLLLGLQRTAAPEKQIERLAKAVVSLGKDEVVSAAQLLQMADIPTGSSVARLVDNGTLFTDLRRCRLADPAGCLVSRTQKVVDSHLLRLDQIAAAAKRPVQLSAKEASEVSHRLLVIREGHQTDRCERTKRRWRAQMRASHGDPCSLRPRHSSKGNRMPRISAEETKVLDDSIRTHFLNPDCTARSAAHAQYLLDHQLAVASGALRPTSCAVCYQTFRRRCEQLPPEHVAGARSGPRAAAANVAPVDPAQASLVPARAFERAHTDHYLCDLYVIVCDAATPFTSKPWITALRDQATGLVLATSLSFSSPSNHSVLQLLRDCARRWGKLPETIVVDNGAEFNSTYFETTLASLAVSKQSRPPGEPRFGGQIEGWFRSLKAYLTKQRGSTNNNARGRSSSRKHKGDHRTQWTLPDAYRAIDEFIFGIYNVNAANDGLQSRLGMFKDRMEAFPESGIDAPYSPQLLACTALPLPRHLKVDRARGVRHNGRWYRHPLLFQHRFHEKPAEAYVEPWDIDTLYVLIEGERIACRHGSIRAADLTTDFTPALDSIRFLGSARGRALLAKAAVLETAKLTRRNVASATAASPPRQPAPRKGTRITLPAKHADVRPYQSGDDQ
jgi:transposase InsO family protein